ncbi:MAG: DNA repair protein RecO [Patescibacteria group bacterium]
MSTYLTYGFVIKVRPWRERDRIYTVLTDKQGKINLLATGSQKIVSKMAGHLWPGQKTCLMVAPGKQFDHLAGVQSDKVFLRPPYYLPNLVLVQSFLELTDVLTEPGQPDGYLLELLEKYLDLTNLLPKQIIDWRPAAKEILAGYILRLLKHQGLAVALSHCDKCKKELFSPAVYNWNQHGFYHQTCADQSLSNVLLSPAALKGLIGHNDLVSQDTVSVAVLPFLLNYLAGQVGREIATLKVLGNLLRYAQ